MGQNSLGRAKIGFKFPILLEDILARVDFAQNVEALRLPGYRLHQLTSNYKGYWSVTVSGNYRVIFQFKDGIATNLDYMNYH